MKRTIALTLTALVLAVAPLAIPPAAADNLSVTVDVPGIAFGYTDGYWDTGHNWHAWRDQREAEAWRAQHADHYYRWRHDRDHDMGWREHNSWWERR